MNNFDYIQNPYPNFSEINNTPQNTHAQNIQNQNFQYQNNDNILYKILPLIFSGKKIIDIMPMLFPNNQMLTSILSNIQTTNKPNPNSEHIPCDKIDMSKYKKVD